MAGRLARLQWSTPGTHVCVPPSGHGWDGWNLQQRHKKSTLEQRECHGSVFEHAGAVQRVLFGWPDISGLRAFERLYHVARILPEASRRGNHVAGRGKVPPFCLLTRPHLTSLLFCSSQRLHTDLHTTLRILAPRFAITDFPPHAALVHVCHWRGDMRVGHGSTAGTTVAKCGDDASGASRFALVAHSKSLSPAFLLPLLLTSLTCASL